MQPQFTLVFEPNTRDALLLEEALKQENLTFPARVLRHASELQSYLVGAGIYSNRELYPMPTLLLLDFCEGVTSTPLLEWLGNRRFLDQFAVIGMGSHMSAHVLQIAFDLGLNAYFEKREGLSALAKMISRVEWFENGELQIPEATLITEENLSEL